MFYQGHQYGSWFKPFSRFNPILHEWVQVMIAGGGTHLISTYDLTF